MGFNGAGEISAADRHPITGLRCTIAGAAKRVDSSSTRGARSASGVSTPREAKGVEDLILRA
jgi:hypothetical protein